MGWQAGQDLCLHALGLNMVSLDWQKHADRIVIGSAQHERTATLRQSDKQIVGVADAMCIGYQRPDVIQRHLSRQAPLFPRDMYRQEATPDRQMSPVICYFDDTANHCVLPREPGIPQLTNWRHRNLARFQSPQRTRFSRN